MSRRRPPQRSQKRPRRGVGTARRWPWLYVAIPAVAVVVLGVGVSVWRQGGSPSLGSPEGVAFPAYVRSAPLSVKEAYAYAMERPEILQYIPCFCGCGQHDGHTSIHDCFVRRGHLSGDPVAFDSHGANCDMCVEAALDTRRLIQQGKTLAEARRFVEARYGSLGPATNTPPVP
ncbi:MAG: hypothetical protein HY686_05700 [Chloroflexi bacterium]|nr:hypothetical protein [Chloroflexota bacterium]